MALFSKKKGEEPNDAQPAEALEANAQEAASKMDAREVAGANERAEGSQAESAGEAKAARSAKAASESASPEKKRGFRGKRRSKRLSKKEMLRVQELEDALAEDADIDAEAIVSMYLPKRRMHRIGRRFCASARCRRCCCAWRCSWRCCSASRSCRRTWATSPST